MSRRVGIALYAIAMAAAITAVDFAFFRNRLPERLIVNLGMVVAFGGFYLRFLRQETPR